MQDFDGRGAQDMTQGTGGTVVVVLGWAGWELTSMCQYMLYRRVLIAKVWNTLQRVVVPKSVVFGGSLSYSANTLGTAYNEQKMDGKLLVASDTC